MSVPNTPRIGVGAVLRRGNAILLLRRRHAPEAGCWSLPGGKLEWMEPLTQAVAREVQEEVGVTVRNVELLGMAEWISPERDEHWTAPVYLVPAFEGEPRLMEPDSHDGIGWFDLNELPEPLTNAAHLVWRILTAAY